MYECLKESIKPELLVLVPVLYLIGTVIKQSSIKSYLIPYILGGIGIVLCGLYVFAVTQIASWQEFLLAVFTSITQGILIAGASVYTNQLIKQAKKKE